LGTCTHGTIGNLEYDDSELSEALSSGSEFWGVAVCLTCGKNLDFQIVRGEVRAITE